MTEPDWGRLPFRTNGESWRAYTETETAPDGTAAGPCVWVERDACFDFAERIGHEMMDAFRILGAGVLRWAAKNLAGGCVLDDKTFEVEFGGALGVKYTVTTQGTHYLLSLSRSYYEARDRSNRGDPLDPDSQLSLREKRLIRAIYRDGPDGDTAANRKRATARRKLRGPVKPEGTLLKKWLP